MAPFRNDKLILRKERRLPPFRNVKPKKKKKKKKIKSVSVSVKFFPLSIMIQKIICKQDRNVIFPECL